MKLVVSLLHTMINYWPFDRLIFINIFFPRNRFGDRDQVYTRNKWFSISQFLRRLIYRIIFTSNSTNLENEILYIVDIIFLASIEIYYHFINTTSILWELDNPFLPLCCHNNWNCVVPGHSLKHLTTKNLSVKQSFQNCIWNK